MSRERPDWTATGDLENRGFGEQVVAADVNGDGYDDLIVMASGRTEPALLPPQVYVFHGSASGLSATPDWVDLIEKSRQGSSFRIAAGDVNGDGFDDLLLSDPEWHVPGGTVDGALFQILGSPTGLDTKVTLLLTGEDAEYQSGPSLAVADVNGDGRDDLLAGFQEAGNVVNDDEGRALLFAGSAKGLAGKPDWSLWGPDDSELGRNVTDLGDVNGDGFDDVGVQTRGTNMVFDGSASGLSRRPSSVRTSYEFDLYSFGILAGLGDLDGDGFGDAWEWSGLDDDPLLQFYRGSPSGLGAKPVARHQGLPLWEIERGLPPGFAGAAGDPNDDGYPDMFFSDPHWNLGGRATVALVFGPLLEPSVPPSGVELLLAPDDFALFGHSVAALDANGDGVNEIAVGAPNLTVDVGGIASLYVGAVFVYGIEP